MIQQRKYHDVSELFPLMDGEEFDALVEDIRINGQREPIWLHDGKIIDGRNRYRACQQLDVEPKYREWHKSGSLVDFVVSLNLHRRHLNSSQRAVLSMDLLPWYESEAKQRQIELAGTRPNNGDLTQIIAEGKGESRQQVASLVGTNRQYVSDVKKLQDKAPQIVKQIRDGKLTVPEAKRVVQTEEKREVWSQPVDPVQAVKGPFGVIYADPPWRYDFSNDNADKIENHYPTMELTEICDLDVKSVCSPDCVLFLWATSPKLVDAMAVMASWGFDYKTCAVWDKEHQGKGYYFRQQHELLLIGTKGEPGTPLQEDRPPSVVRAKKGKHSEKPDEFYEIIERMYPHLPKVELFARRPREGWGCWGNEV